MSHYFLDTSALVKLYVRERGTDRMIDLASNALGALSVLSLARVEVCAAVHRRRRMGDLSPADCALILTQFQGQLGAVFHVEPVSDSVLSQACALVEDHDLRAYDAMQLAGCLSLRPSRQQLSFVCADGQLLEAARRCGLPVIDPLA